MAFIDGTVVNVALPALQTNLNATAVDAQWVIEAYSLLLSAFLLVGGSLGDHYGRRRIFLLGVILFAIASAASGLAGNIGQLIAARAFQGFGAALLVPGSLAIISDSFSEQERGRAIGTWSGLSAITTGIGPVLGGWLIEHVSWRAVFLIDLPAARCRPTRRRTCPGRPRPTPARALAARRAPSRGRQEAGPARTAYGRRPGRPARCPVRDDERVEDVQGDRVEVVARPVHRRPDAGPRGQHGQVGGRGHGEVRPQPEQVGQRVVVLGTQPVDQRGGHRPPR